MRRHLVEQSKIERVDLKTDRILLLRRQRDPEFRPSPSGETVGSKVMPTALRNIRNPVLPESTKIFVLEIFEKNSYSWV